MRRTCRSSIGSPSSSLRRPRSPRECSVGYRPSLVPQSQISLQYKSQPRKTQPSPPRNPNQPLSNSHHQIQLSYLSPRKAPSSDPTPTQAAAPAPEPAPSTGFFTSMVASLTGAKPAPDPPTGQLEDDTDMYYNKELGRWVERGKENEVAEAAAAPPPMASDTSAQPSDGQAAPGSGFGAPVPVGAPTTAQGRRSRLANLRYVNTYGNGAAAAPQGATTGVTPDPNAAGAPKPKMMMFGAK